MYDSDQRGGVWIIRQGNPDQVIRGEASGSSGRGPAQVIRGEASGSSGRGIPTRSSEGRRLDHQAGGPPRSSEGRRLDHQAGGPPRSSEGKRLDHQARGSDQVTRQRGGVWIIRQGNPVQVVRRVTKIIGGELLQWSEVTPWTSDVQARAAQGKTLQCVRVVE